MKFEQNFLDEAGTVQWEKPEWGTFAVEYSSLKAKLQKFLGKPLKVKSRASYTTFIILDVKQFKKDFQDAWHELEWKNK